MQANTQLLAVVLVGGQSRRMGQDKVSLYAPRWQMTLFERCIASLLPLNPGQIVTSGRMISPNYPEIADIYPQRGPLSGIHASLAYCQAHSQFRELLFLAVDMPQLGCHSLQALLEFGRQQQRVSSFSQSPIPLYMPLRPDSLVLVEQQLQGDDWSLRQLLSLHQGQCLPGASAEQFININHPQDWQQHCG